MKSPNGSQQPSDRTPPHNLVCEQAVLAQIMLSNDKYTDVATVLKTPEAFFRDSHQLIYRSIQRLATEGNPVDLFSVSEDLKRHGSLSAVGGDEALFDILEQVGSDHAVYYAQIVQQKHVLRQSIEIAKATLLEAYADRYTADEVLLRASQRFNGVAVDNEQAKTVTIAEIMPRVFDRIRARQVGDVSGLLSGFTDLDGITDGFQPQEFVILAARPSMGKTACGLNMGEYAAVLQGKPVLFVSLEMNEEALTERLAISRARIDGHKIRTGGRLTREEWDRLEDARRDMEAAPFHIIERPARNILQITNEIRAAHRKLGLGLTVVDYIQIIDSDNDRDNEVAAITKISKALKATARECNMPIVALSQLSRKLEDRDDKRPKMSDLRGSGGLEQDADIILFLHRPEYFDPNDSPGEAECIVSKNRNGRTGSFKLTFINSCMRFENYSPREPSAQDFGQPNEPF